MSCLIYRCIWNRSLNVWFIFVFVTWEVGVANLKCFILKFWVNEWECHVTRISSVSTCISQCICNISIVICDVAWKRDIAFTSFDSTSEGFRTIRLLDDTQINIRLLWKITFNRWTIYWKCCVVIKIGFIASWLIRFKELPNTKSITTFIWVQGITRLVEVCIFNRCTVRIWNSWYSGFRTFSICRNWCQLCWDCWCTINSCVSFKTCCCQCCHHIIHWLAQSFALISIGLSSCISVCQLISCCQFWLNFSNSIIDCFFLLCILMVRRIFFCDFVQ